MKGTVTTPNLGEELQNITMANEESSSKFEELRSTKVDTINGSMNIPFLMIACLSVIIFVSAFLVVVCAFKISRRQGYRRISIPSLVSA